MPFIWPFAIMETGADRWLKFPHRVLEVGSANTENSKSRALSTGQPFLPGSKDLDKSEKSL